MGAGKPTKEEMELIFRSKGESYANVIGEVDDIVERVKERAYNAIYAAWARLRDSDRVRDRLQRDKLRIEECEKLMTLEWFMDIVNMAFTELRSWEGFRGNTFSRGASASDHKMQELLEKKGSE
jgi:hypothetical protein